MAETTESIYKTLAPDGQIRYLKWMKDDKGTWYQYTDDGSYPKGQQAWADGMAGKADYGNDGRTGLMKYGIIPL